MHTLDIFGIMDAFEIVDLLQIGKETHPSLYFGPTFLGSSTIINIINNSFFSFLGSDQIVLHFL